MNCHGDTPWDSASVLTCTQSCHGYPPSTAVTAGYSRLSGQWRCCQLRSVMITPNGIQYLKDNHGGASTATAGTIMADGSLPIIGDDRWRS